VTSHGEIRIGVLAGPVVFSEPKPAPCDYPTMMSLTSARFTLALRRAMRVFATSTALSAAGMLVAGATTGCQGLCTDSYQATQLEFEEASALQIRPRAAVLDGEERGLLVGDAGTILHQDADGLWIDRSPGETADLHSLALRGSRVIAVGSGGTILVSDDNGETWAPQISGTQATLHAVTFLDEGEAVAVGDGVVLISDNSGDSWSPADLPENTGVELRAIGGTSSLAYAVGLAGAVLMSEDNGQSWVELEHPTESDLVGVDLRHAVLASDGTLYTYSDGEWVWTGDFAAPVEAVDPGLSWVVLTDGTVATLTPDWYGLEALTPLPEGSATPRVILPRGDSATLLGDTGERLEASITEEWVDYKTRCVNFPGRAIDGRPFYVDGQARTAPIVDREGWSQQLSLEVNDLSPETREALAEAWAIDGAYEHASIASFARFILDLMAVGAPANLVAAAQEALSDEIHHARACFNLASAYAGQARGPGAFSLDRAFAGKHDLTSLALSTFVEGCINETIAAIEAEVAHSLAEVPLVRKTLGQIAADETRHAALAWDTLAWCISVAGEPLREALGEHYVALQQQAAGERAVVADIDTTSMNLTRHGRLGERSRALIAAKVRHSLILPRLARLLGKGASPQQAHDSQVQANPPSILTPTVG